ncbi:MAG: M14 family zinc carboxypeptidase [Bacteroidota bacterium]
MKNTRILLHTAGIGGLFWFLGLSLGWAQTTPHEKNGANYSATYTEAIAFYEELANGSPLVEVKTYADGTDAGLPLHLVVITNNPVKHPVPLRQADRRFVLILNGIHPGEPCGVDASMALARDLATQPAYKSMLEHLVVCIVPVYNVGGALNRNSTSRANQNGPDGYGFRGNARLLDLNRDFIKADSRNAQTFNRIFTEWRPDVFIDTHTSNGADYQYTMTYIPTQKDKVHPAVAEYMNTVLNPQLEAKLKENYPMCPYVQTMGWQTPPDSGISAFLETPRYSTGYAALYNTIGYTTESHMLKPFADRVGGTYTFMLELLKYVNRDRTTIGRMRRDADASVQKQEEFTLRWALDPTVSHPINFRGYTATTITSQVTGQDRLTYDQNQPWTREIPYYDTYKPVIKVKKPYAYIVPQAWREAVERLEWNGVALKRLGEDVKVPVEVSYLDKFQPSPRPYEGHYPISGIELRRETQVLQFRAGDYVVFTDQVANRYIVETLEPEAHDSYLHWNFFDEIFQRKEYFSPYIFEETAQKMLETDPALKQKLQEKIQSDSSFVNNDWAQLDFIYRNSPHYEPSHLRYPVVRINEKQKLPLAK